MNAFTDMVGTLTTHVEGVEKRKKEVRESAVERYLHDQVTLAGGTTRKFKSPGRANVPDRIVVWKDAIVIPPKDHSELPRVVAEIHFVECKRPGQGARPGQVREHERLRKLGCTVLVLDTKEQVDDYVARQK